MIWHIYKKELIDCLRDRKTIIFSVLIPILLNVGMLFFVDRMMSNNQPDGMSIAVEKGSDTSVVEWLKEDRNLQVVESEDPLQTVEKGKASVALKVDKEFSDKILHMQSPDVMIYTSPDSVESSRTKEYVTAILNKQRDGIIKERLTQLNINDQTIQPFYVKEQSFSNKDNSSLIMVAIYAPMIIALGVLGGIVPSANDIFAGEKERKTMEALLMAPIKRLHLLIGKWFTISTFGVLSGVLSTISFVLFVRYFTVTLNDALNLNNHLIAFSASLLVAITLFALLAGLILCIFSLLASSVKEAQSYTSQIVTVAILPCFLLMGKSVNEMQSNVFLIPIYNVFALMKQLLYGVYDMQSLGYTIGSLSVCIIVLFTIGYTIFTKSRWVLGKG